MSVFDGTWRPDPQRPADDGPVEELLLADGVYSCLSCEPAYRIAADGEPHRAEAATGFDELIVNVADRRTVRRQALRAGTVVLEATTVLSPFGQTKRETQRRFGVYPEPFEFAITSRRLGPAPDGAHQVSGRWRAVEADLPNHEEDTIYRVTGDVLSMRDGFGRSYEAPLNGAPAPYLGDPRISSVSVRQIDDSTFEEVDSNGADVILTARWQFDPDGRTIHVQFRHPSGLVQEQDGRRIG